METLINTNFIQTLSEPKTLNISVTEIGSLYKELHFRAPVVTLWLHLSGCKCRFPCPRAGCAKDVCGLEEWDNCLKNSLTR